MFSTLQGREQRTGLKVHNISINVNIIEFHYYIWNHHGKCIQISTKSPGIGLEMFEILRISRNHDFVWMVKPMAPCKVLNELHKK